MPTSTTAAPIRTPQEIEDLKINWKKDPCWDIEDTDGFEAHREELKAYGKAVKAADAAYWDALQQARRDKQRTVWGANVPDAALDYIAAMETRVNALEETVGLIKPDALYKY